MSDILTPISPGELLDKLTILTIKLEKISDVGKLANVKTEYEMLYAVAQAQIDQDEVISTLQGQLLDVNRQLWKIEDDIRDCERDGDFGDTFVQLARAVYVTNDKRAALKKDINLALNSTIVEEKSYADY